MLPRLCSVLGETLISVFGERRIVAVGKESVDVGLGVPVFITVARVAEEAVVAETLQVLVFDAQ